MTLRQLLTRVGWSPSELARRLKCNERGVRRWVSDGTTPPSILAWLEEWAAFGDTHPPPQDWRQKPAGWSAGRRCGKGPDAA